MAVACQTYRALLFANHVMNAGATQYAPEMQEKSAP